MSGNPNAPAAPRACAHFPYGSAAIRRVNQQVSLGDAGCVDDNDLLEIVQDMELFWTIQRPAAGADGPISHSDGHDEFVRRLYGEVQCARGMLWERHRRKMQYLSTYFANSTVDFMPLFAKAEQVCTALRLLDEVCGTSAMGQLPSDQAEDDEDPASDMSIEAALDVKEPKSQELLYKGVLAQMLKDRVYRWGEDTYRIVWGFRNINLPESESGSDTDTDTDTDSNDGQQRVSRRIQFDTRSMVRGKSVRTYVNETCSRINTNAELYRVSVEAGDVSAMEKVIKRIVGTDEIEGVSHYKPCRTTFSFRNSALCMAGSVQRMPHDHIPLGEHAANYFDYPLPQAGFTEEGVYIEGHSAWDTPALDSMLGYQNITGELYRVFTGLCIGRLCFDINTEHSDNWQVVPLLLGQAGTGKSTIIEQIVYQIYGKDHCGIIPNKANANFMGYAFENKHLWVCSEVTQECTWDQSLFQQIVSGETFASERKFRDLKWVESTFPGIMCSNTGLPFMDTMGSIQRRIVCFFYNQKVAPADQDSGLQDRVFDEFSRILVKSVANYHWLRKQVQAAPYNGRLWAFLNARHGDYFERGRMKSLAGTSVLNEFLYHSVYVDKSIVRDKAYYIEFETFKLLAESWCDETNRRKPDWVLDTIKAALSPMSATFDGNKTLRWPPTQMDFHTGKFVLGIALKDHAVNAASPISWTPLVESVGLHVIYVSVSHTDGPSMEVHCELPGAIVARIRAEHPKSLVVEGEPTYKELLEVVRDKGRAPLVPSNTHVHEGAPHQNFVSATGARLAWLTRVVQG
mgnify:CR=1 FL=1|tara:strand:- start:1286 stop:3679 length:2394 start_codon:yes stop_codon:yes gene_type:complete